jgi:hypothetical protein
MTMPADTDIYAPGEQAQALALAAFGGRGFLTPNTLDRRGLVEVPFTFGELAQERRDRLAALAARGATDEAGIMPVPVGEPQGLDTIAFFAACRLACPGAHLVVDLERFGHKLGQLCLSFGADEILGPIVERRELRLGARAGSKELTRHEAAELLRAAGFAPCERLPDGGTRPL